MDHVESRIDLDYNAGAPPLQAARDALESAAGVAGNPSSAHAQGRLARQLLERARAQVAELAGVPAARVVFTSGGTEAAHAALHGLAWGHREAGRRRVVISGLEHPCMRAAALGLGREGFEIEVVPPGADGVIDAGRFLESCLDGCAAAALMAAQNEIGTLQPVAEVADGLADRGVPLVVDAVQAVDRTEREVWGPLHAATTLSAHKLGGFAGSGAVILPEKARMIPLIAGGEQERGWRGGTPAVLLAAAFGAAAVIAARRPVTAWDGIETLRDRFESHLAARLDGVVVLGKRARRLPNTSAFRVRGLRGEDLAAALDLDGIAVSTGSACSTGAARPSATLLAMGLSAGEAREMVRVSLGPATPEEAIDRAVAALVAAASRLRRHLAPARAGR
jgi:cysteine desulfurase